MTLSPDAVLESQLDAEQLTVAVAEGNLLVLAPPGSGKTRVLVNAAAHRVRNGEAITGRRHTRAMCLTFGTDAASEMKQRLGRRPLSIPSQRLWVSNYHGVCALLLRRYGHLIGWPRSAGIAGTVETQGVLAEAISDLGIRNLNAGAVTTAISHLKGGRSSEPPSSRLQAIRARYDALLAERNMRDFDDLIAHACQLLASQERVRCILHDAYPFVFVDELQDTNVAQLELLGHLVGPATSVFGVADDDQMIYGWRDAHPENLHAFIEMFRATEQPLVGNYRCPPAIVAAANRIISENPDRRKQAMESRVTTRHGELIVMTASTVSEPDAIVAAIERSLSDGYELGDIAILAPHTFKFDDVADALESAGITHTRVGRGARTIADNPTIRLLAQCLRHLAGATLTPGELSGIGGSSPEELINEIVQACSKVAAGAPRGVVNRLLREFDLGTTSYPKRSADEVKVLAAMARKAYDDQGPASVSQLAELVIRDWDRLERSALESTAAVKLMTSFAAKGTEFPVVILPYLNKGLVPYKRRNEDIDWPEARRLFYVALTRTEHRAVLIHDGDLDPSAFLEAVLVDATEAIVL